MIWLILILATVLRLIKLDQSFWLDEAASVMAAQTRTLWSMIVQYPIGDYHPAGYFSLLWLWGHVFGFGEIQVRLLSVLFGLGIVFLIYLLCRKLFFDQKIGLLASLLAAVAPLLVYYSQEARMYSMAAFFATASVYFLIKIINQEKYAFWGYTISNIFLLYSDYVAYLLIPAQIFFLIVTQKKIWRVFLLSWSISLLAFAPWFLILPQQIQTGFKAASDLPIWRESVGEANLKNVLLIITKTLVGRISFDNQLIYGSLTTILGIICGLVIIIGVKKFNVANKLLLSWLIIPVILATVISLFVPLLSYFRLIFVLPAFYVLIAFGLTILPKAVFKSILILILTANLIFLGIYYFNPRFQREDWRGAVKFLNQIETDQTAILFENNTLSPPFLYYKNNLTNSWAGLKKIQARSLEDVIDLKTTLKNKNSIYVLEYLVEITDPNRLLEQTLQQIGYQKIATYDFSGIGFVNLYEKD